MNTPRIKTIFQADYNKENDAWIGDGCYYKLYYKELIKSGSLTIKKPELSTSHRFPGGTKTHVLPIHLSFKGTSQGRIIIKEFLNVIKSISLSNEERLEFDNENIPYYQVEWIEDNYYFRDFLSTVLFSEIVRIINHCFFDDYCLSISSIDGTTDVYNLKTSPSVIESGMRIFGIPCDILAEYYVYSYNRPEYHYDGRPYLHLNYRSDGKTKVYGFSCAEAEDEFNQDIFNFLYEMVMWMYDYPSAKIGESNTILMNDNHLQGKRLRGDVGNFNLVIQQQDNKSTTDTPIVDFYKVEMPLYYNPVAIIDYRNRKPIARFESGPIHKFLSGEDGSIYEYDIDLPLSTEQIQRLTGVEMIPMNQ